MKTRELFTTTLSVIAGLVVGISALVLRADEIKRRDDAPRPMLAAEAAKHFRLPKDLKIDIAACEPLLRDPSSIAWDEHGRMFVGEIHGYNLEGHLDIQELNQLGQLDKIVRRIPASDAAKEAAEKETYGTVKMLIDDDGDGRMDRAQVWADRLPPCFGIVPARGGIIAIGRPDIIYLADRDNDGHAEVRETLFTGFEITILERSINNPRWGLDNWIYVSAGRAGGQITGPHLEQSVYVGATDFRFKPDGSAIEPVTGRNYMFGQTMTDWGDRFVTPPALYAIPIPQRYLNRNPFVPSPNSNASAASYNRIYPDSRAHPWRVERSEKKQWNKYYSDRYGAAESAPNGYFTSACGQMIYRAGSLPESYHGNHFCCDPAQNLVHRSLLTRHGLRFEAVRAPTEQQSEFLTSTDQWFRPLNLSTGPDGALYIVDMYREIIEDYSAIPRYLQQQYGLMEGNNHGRIWRVSSQQAVSHPRASLVKLSDSELISELAHPNSWWRLTAQRLLVERGATSVAQPLETVAREGSTPQARLHALYTLDGLRVLQPAGVELAIDDPHFAVRLHALRLCEPWLDERPSLLNAVINRVDDTDARVRLQLALTLGESKSEQTTSILARLAATDGQDEWFQAAILSSVTETPNRLVEAVLQPAGKTLDVSDSSRSVLQALSSLIGARCKNKEVVDLLATIASLQSNKIVDTQVASLEGLLEGLQRGNSQSLEAQTGRESLQRLLANRETKVRSLALRIAGITRLTDSTEMKPFFAKAAQQALDEKLSTESRQAAIETLQSAPDTLLIQTVEQLINPVHSPVLQLSAIAAVAESSSEQLTPMLLSQWSSSTPVVREAILDAVFSRVSRLPQLLDAIAEGTVSAQSLSTLRRTQLLDSSDASVQSRAQELIAMEASSMDPKLLERYRAALNHPHDTDRGKIIFEKTCAGCHRVNDRTPLVGPDLAAIQSRTDEVVLLDILQPSAKITAGYQSYVVVDSNGRIHTGIMSSETPTSVTLRMAPLNNSSNASQSTTERVVLRKDIEEMKALPQSLMPDGLTKEVTPQDMAHVIGYLRQLLGPPVPPQVTLFDENTSLLVALDQGPGTAQEETTDCFSGKVALKIIPPQRYSPRIPGWSFSIREFPEPGEFRFLRLAWKTNGGRGVMIELADNQQWPDGGQPERRYYAGQNTTAWKAMEVSEYAPKEWTVATLDLWKDSGDFVLTGMAPTAMGGEALFDRIELIRSLDDLE